MTALHVASKLTEQVPGEIIGVVLDVQRNRMRERERATFNVQLDDWFTTMNLSVQLGGRKIQLQRSYIQ